MSCCGTDKGVSQSSWILYYMESLMRINCGFFLQKDDVQKLNEDFDGPLKQRSCTDIVCLILFISYIGGLVRMSYKYITICRTQTKIGK